MMTEMMSQMMKQFCGQSGKPDTEQMKQLMERCGC